MPEIPPDGILPLFLRGTTCEKFGFKTGEGVLDLVEYLYLSKEEIQKEIVNFGVMSDFEVAKKQVEISPGDKLLFVVDKQQKYGETILLYYTEATRNEFTQIAEERERQLELEKQAAIAMEEARKAAEWARQNVVFVDEPMSTKPWVSNSTAETESEIRSLNTLPTRERLTLEIYRPKSLLNGKCKLVTRNADVGGVQEFRSHKDPHFTPIKEQDLGIQAAPTHNSSFAQTTWFRSINKAIQYEAANVLSEPSEGNTKDELCSFLENATITIELALQQNETVDIFTETFHIKNEDGSLEGTQADNELREIKNFADPTYSKLKVLPAIDWMPKNQGIVAVSAVRNLTFDERIPISGQTHLSYILIWDFRQLVRPLLLLQSPSEIFTFRFNPINPNIIVGGCLNGQCVIWDITEPFKIASRKNNRGGSSATSGGQDNDLEEEENASAAVAPKWLSNVDFSHKKPVADLLWLSPNVQINYRGQIIGSEHIDGQCYQFISVAGDGQVMVWDVRFEEIANDELRHIGRSKHIAQEKAQGKDNNAMQPSLCPILRAHLKRLEGVGELSLCKVCCNLMVKQQNTSNKSGINGDPRAQFLVATEEGDLLLTDLNVRKEANARDDDEEDVGDSREFVRWIARDHPRAAVCLQPSPFFPEILLSVGDTEFHLWKIGEDKPLFTSPMAHTYLTAGAWSPTRPALLVIACTDGSLLVWDFTDSSYKQSIDLKATHSTINSLEFLTGSATSRQQLIAIGDVTGTLHVCEMPRNLVRPAHKEDLAMANFIDRELKRVEYLKIARAADDELRQQQLIDSDRNQSSGSGKDGADISKTENFELLKKEEDEFNKLEALFVTDLAISNEDLPQHLRTDDPGSPSMKRQGSSIKQQSSKSMK